MTNPFKKIIDYFRKSYWTHLGSVLFGETAQQPTNRDYLDSYEACSLVNICIRKIAEKVASVEFKLYKVNGRAGAEKIDEVPAHPLLDLLAQVNPFVTKFEMMDDTQTYIELLGNSYWLKVRGERSNKILELWQLRPDWVTIKEDPEKIIKEYDYRLPNGTTQTFKPEDIIHFKQPNPKSFLYGLPTVKAAIDIIRTAIFTTRWNMNFFYNQARPDMLLIAKGGMSPDAKKEIERQWRSKYGGVEGAHKFGVLEGDIEIKNLTTTMKDMDFPKLRESNTQDILAAFGVPKSIIGLQGMNRAEAEAQVYVFLSETIEPKVRRIVERLNEFLVPEYGDNLYLDFVDPTPENREAITKEYETSLKNNWRVINEVRDLENLPPLEGGWSFYLPITMMPAGGLGEKSLVGSLKIGELDSREYYKMKKERSQDLLRRKVLAGKRKLKLKMRLKEELRELFIKIRTKPLTKDEKERYWQEHDKILSGDEKLFAALTRRLLKNQEERIQEALESQFTGKAFTKGKYDLVNWDLEDRIFFELSVPIFSDIVERRGARAAALVGAEEFIMTDRIRKMIDKKAFKFAEEVNKTTREKLRNTLSEGVKEGEGVKELSKRVSGVFKTRRGFETERIARTEVIEASSRADLEAFAQSGVVERKEWFPMPDACEICLAMEGEVVGLREQFSAGFDCPPAHPNCKCALLPVIET